MNDSIEDTTEVVEPHTLTEAPVTDEAGNAVPQWVLQGAEVNRAFINDLEVVGLCATLTDVGDDETGIAIIVISAELARQLGAALTTVAASVRPLTKQIEARAAAEALIIDNEENSK